MKTVTRRGFVGGVAVLPALRFTAAHAQAGVSPAEARAIAKEAYIYGFPIVDNYRIQHAYWVDRSEPGIQGALEPDLQQSPASITPADTAIQTPNSDTPYSFIGADLRAEPLVLTVPAMEKERYFSVQLIDYYTFNFDYIGTPHDRQRRRQLPARRAGLERRDAQGRQEGLPLRDRTGVPDVSHAALRSGRPRQREEGPGRLQGAAALGVSRPACAQGRTGHRFHQAADACRAEDLARSSSTS